MTFVIVYTETSDRVEDTPEFDSFEAAETWLEDNADHPENFEIVDLA